MEVGSGTYTTIGNGDSLWDLLTYIGKKLLTETSRLLYVHITTWMCIHI